MRIRFRGVLPFIITVVTGIILGARGIAADADPAACPRTLPANIDLPRDLERMLAKIYRGSETFRGQCDRIAAARTLSVTLQLDTNIPRSCMAFTRFQRKGYAVYADVHLPPSGTMMAQLVGHEFEHVVRGLREHACTARRTQRGCRGRDAANGGLNEPIIGSACSSLFSIGSRTTARSPCLAC